MNNDLNLMTPQDLSEYLRLSVQTLQTWRSRGKGPAYIKTAPGGNVLYRVEEVERWLAERQVIPEGRR